MSAFRGGGDAECVTTMSGRAVTTFEKWRDLLMSELFARAVCVVFFAWIVIVWSAWQHADQRADTAEHKLVRAEAQLRHINANCVRNDAGEGVCRAGTFLTATTVTP